MKGFIEITDLENRVHYINVSYIVKFEPASQRNQHGNTSIRITGFENNYSIATDLTPTEVSNLIIGASK